MQFLAQFSPVKVPAPVTPSAGLMALVAGFQQLSPPEQAQLFNNLITTPGGNAANKDENFSFTWTGIGIGLAAGAALTFLATRHFGGR